MRAGKMGKEWHQHFFGLQNCMWIFEVCVKVHFTESLQSCYHISTVLAAEI